MRGCNFSTLLVSPDPGRPCSLDSHDAYYTFLDLGLDSLHLLLTEPDQWLATVPPPNARGVKKLDGVSVIVRNDPGLNGNKCRITGMPASKTLIVDFNYAPVPARPEKPHGLWGMGFHRAWIADSKIDVTFRRKTGLAFVHVEMPHKLRDGTPFPEGEAFYRLLLHPKVFPDVLKSMPVNVSIVEENGQRSPAVVQPPEKVTFSLSASSPAMIYSFGASGSKPCASSMGAHSGSDAPAVDAQGILLRSTHLEITTFVVARWQ